MNDNLGCAVRKRASWFRAHSSHFLFQGLPLDDDISALRQRNYELLEENASLLEQTVQLQKAGPQVWHCAAN